MQNPAHKTPQYKPMRIASMVIGGSPVASFPQNWDKFTQLVGPYAIKNLVQGHMINEKIGGHGDADNLAPLASSANTRHWSSVEAPIKAWLDLNPKNLIDYKITPRYTGAWPSLKNTLIAEFKKTHTEGTSDTALNLRAWVDNYIDQTIPSRLDIEVYFSQANALSPFGGADRARRKPLIQGQVLNTSPAAYTGPNVTGGSGAYSGWLFKIPNTITYKNANVGTNTGTQGYAKMIDNTHFGTAVGSRPTDWEKFTRLVGPDAVTDFVQGHLINQKIGGQGIAKNLTPLTSSANAVHSTSVEEPIKRWLEKDPTAKGYTHLVDYKVTPQYGGANPALKTDLLKSFDDTNGEIRGDTRHNLILWLTNYINATFPCNLDIDVYFMQANGTAATKGSMLRAKRKPLLQGHVTNEPL